MARKEERLLLDQMSVVKLILPADCCESEHMLK
jgi:hypothetical protein